MGTPKRVLRFANNLLNFRGDYKRYNGPYEFSDMVLLVHFEREVELLEYIAGSALHSPSNDSFMGITLKFVDYVQKSKALILGNDFKKITEINFQGK